MMKKNIRPNDLLGRFGGEEFVILLPATHLEDAEALAKRVRAAVEEMTVSGLTTLAGGERIDPIRVCTVSIGVGLAQPGDAYEELFKAADAAVYEAKRTGRNKVVVDRTSTSAAPDTPDSTRTDPTSRVSP